MPPTLERLHIVLDAWGADPEHWPVDERDELLALLDGSLEAQELRASVAALDSLIAEDRDSDRAVSAPVELTRAILSSIPDTKSSAYDQDTRGLPPVDVSDDPPRRAAVRGPATWGLPLAAAAALALIVWTNDVSDEAMPKRVTDTAHTSEGTADARTPAYALLEWDQYEMPSDELDASATDWVGELPEVGCPEGTVGCLDLSTSEPDQQANRPRTGRIHA